MFSASTINPQDLQKSTISTIQLHHLVESWSSNLQPQTKQPTFRYKFNLNHILPLPQNLLTHLLLYVCYLKFPFVLVDLTPQLKLKTNLSLKSLYQQQFYQGNWKKQFFFEFSMVYLTKTAAKFLAAHFPSLQINQNLETQLYIILHNVLIGNQVGTKIFHLLSKKYLKSLTHKSPKHPFKPSISLHKKDSFITLHKPSSKYISEVIHSETHSNTKNRTLQGKQNPHGPQNVNPRRYFKNKVSMIKVDSWQRSTIDIFTEQLKKNLYVPPLPVLSPKKMDITDYDQVHFGQGENKEKKQLGQTFLKPVNLRTTKITSSMETLLSLHHPNISAHEPPKPGKILLSRQLNSKHYCLTSCSHHKDHSEKSQIQVQQKESKSKHGSSKNPCKMSYEDWNQLLSKIRFSSKHSTMFEKENPFLGRSFDSTNHNKTLKQITYERSFQKDDSQVKPLKVPSLNRLATQHYTTGHSAQFEKRKSESLQKAQKLEASPYGKLSKFAKTIDPDNQIHDSQSQAEESLPFLRKTSPSHQKLCKTSKLKLEKLLFLSDCKNRENKLSQTTHNNHVKLVLY